MVARDLGSTHDDLTRRLPADPTRSPMTGQPVNAYQTPTADEDASAMDKAAQAAETAKEKAGDATHAAREQASHAVHAATGKVDAQRDTVAGSLDTVATQLRERAEMIPGGERTTEAAQTAARGIESASGYVREHDVNDMMSDLERVVRSHPTESLIVALAAGFLVGRMVKS